MKKTRILSLLLLISIITIGQSIKPSKQVDISTCANPYNITLTSYVEDYYFSGSLTSTKFTVGITGTPKEGTTINIFWNGCFSGTYVIVLNDTFKTAQICNKVRINAYYKSSAWKVFKFPYESLGDGTADGQVPYWDNTAKTYDASEHLIWNETYDRLYLNQQYNAADYDAHLIYERGPGEGINIVETGTGDAIALTEDSAGNGLSITEVLAGDGVNITETGDDAGINVSETDAGDAVTITETDAGYGINLTETGTNDAIIISETDAGNGITISEEGTGVGLAVTAVTGYAATIQGGNVGIGTATPTYTLDVTGNGRITDSLNVDGSVTIGTRKAGTTGTKSFVQGLSNLASGIYSSAIGYNTTASGQYSHSEGSSTTASGNYSHSEGSSNTASGNYSHVEGSSNTASGSNSHAEGSSNTASGNTSHAEGVGTISFGYYSHTSGMYTKSNSYSEFVLGRYNDTTNSTTEGAWVSTDNAFVIGNGATSSTRSNSFVILKNAGVIYGVLKTGTIVAGTGITTAMLARNMEFDGTTVDISANPQIAAGTDGQEIQIMNTTAAQTLTLEDGTGLVLSAASIVLATTDVITLRYSVTLSAWVQVGYSDN